MVDGSASAHLDGLLHWHVSLGRGGSLFGSHLRKELLSCGLVIEAGFVQIGVVSDVVEAWTFVSVVLEEAEDETLEFLGQTSTVDFREVGINLASEEQVVEELFLASLFEGEDALHHDEEDNSHRE